MAGEHDLVFRAVGTAETAAGVDEVTVKLDDQKRKVSDIRRENQMLDRESRRIKQSQETAEQQYHRLLERSQKMLQSNRLELPEYNREVQRIKQSYANLSGEFEKFSSSSQASFGEKAISVLTRYAGALAVIKASLAVITSELDKQKELRQRQQTDVERVAGSRMDLRASLPSANEALIQNVFSRTQAIANRLNISEAFVNEAQIQALSAADGTDEEKADKALRAVEIAARYSFYRPEQISLTAGTLLDVSQSTGTSDAMVNLGIIKKIGELSRVGDRGSAAKSIPRALTSATGLGASLSEAAAIFETLTMGMADKTGDISATATRALATRLSNLETPIPNATFTEKIAYLQGNKDAGKAFVDQINDESKGAVTKWILDPSSTVARNYRSLLPLIPSDPRRYGEMAAYGLSTLRAMENDRINQLGNEDRLAGGIQERASLLSGTGGDDRISDRMFAAATEVLMKTGPMGWQPRMAVEMGLRGGPGWLSGNPTRERVASIVQQTLNDIDQKQSRTSPENYQELLNIWKQMLASSQKQEELLRNQRPPGNQVGQGNGMLGGND